MDWKPLVWLFLGATIVAAWLWLAPEEDVPDWRIQAESPRIVGDSIDPFVYAGGELVRSIDGSAELRWAEASAHGMVRTSIASPQGEAVLSLRDGSAVGRRWELVSVLDASAEVWFDAAIHGRTGLGERRLPETTARIAGQSRFDLTVDGDRQLTGISGLWSVAEALRQADGSIRQQGLVFSPLLRDKTGFADPDRLELTLLLYEGEPGSNVLFHVVFSDVTIEQSPSVP